MKTEKKTSLIRNILWAILLVIALARGISTGHWKAFIFLAILFVISKGTLLIGQYKLRKATKHLVEESLAARGLPEYIPEPSIIDAMQKKTAAIIEEINRLHPPKQCLRFAIDHNRKPSVFESKLGGMPYWDNTQPYPTDANGKPMAMVMQVNFGDMPHLDPLPQEGILQYFISADENIIAEGYGVDFDNPVSQTNFRVVYHKVVDKGADISLLGQYPRIETIEGSPVMDEFALCVRQSESCINESDFDFEDAAAQAVRNLYGEEMGTSFVADYVKKILPEEKREQTADELALGDNTMFQAVSEENFQMLGYPAFEQYDEVGSQFDSLLLQIPTIDATDNAIDDYQYDTIWGDCGSVRLFINSGNLRRLDFSSEVLCVFQCY